MTRYVRNFGRGHGLLDPPGYAYDGVDGHLLVLVVSRYFCSETCLRIGGQSSYPPRHPTSWASPQRSHTVPSTPYYRTWTSAQLSAHFTCPPGGNAWHLKSRHPFIPAAHQLIGSFDGNRSTPLWADRWWNADLLENTPRIPLPSPRGGFGGLSPPKQSSKSLQIKTWNTRNHWISVFVNL